MIAEVSPAKPDFSSFFFEKLHSFLQENQDRCDVTFSVGPTKEEVKAARLILEAASVEMRKLFQEKWDLAVIIDGEGIPLPDFDPEAFRMFLKLLPLDPMSEEFAKSLGLNSNLIFSIIDICKVFEMKELKSSLEVLAAEYLRKFATFIKTPEFLDLSPQVLNTILSNDCIHLDEVLIFDGVYKWAEYQCAKGDLEINGTNIRQVLGDCLFEIRFPLISVDSFNKIVRPKNILTNDEKLAVFEYITLDSKDAKEFDATGFVFKMGKRTGTVPVPARPSRYSISYKEANPPARSPCLTAQLFSNCYISAGALPFICDGTWKTDNKFSFSQNVEIVGLEFFGPVDGDAEYEVRVVSYHSVVPKVRLPGTDFKTASTTNWIPCGFVNDTIRAVSGKRFKVFFTEPIFVPSNNSWKVDFSLKGPLTLCWDTNLSKSRMHGGVTITLSKTCQQLSAILFYKH